MPADWDLLLKSYIYLVKKIQRDAFRRHAHVLTGRVLDAGCGGQAYRRYLTAASEYVGMEYARRLRPAVCGDVQALPFASEAFDSVLCTEVLEHVPRPWDGWHELHRVVKPGGTVMVTVPMMWNLHYQPYDFYRYTPYGITFLAEQAGLRVTHMERIGGLFALFGSRLTDTGSQLLMRWLHWLPRRLRHATILCYTVPVTLLFGLLAVCFDRLDGSDAIGWLTILERPADDT